MFKILKDKTICITNGDIANFDVFAKLKDGNFYVFNKGDIVRFTVFKKKDVASIMISKDFVVEEESESVTIHLTSQETRFKDINNQPVDYWYEIVINPDTAPQTIVGYDETGEKIYRLFPRGAI